MSIFKSFSNVCFLASLLVIFAIGCGDGTPFTVAAPKTITAYSLAGVPGIVNETSKTIAVTVPYGTNVTALAATFTTTGASVKVGSVTQVSGTTVNNFTAPVVYTVTATDGTTATYTVTVTAALNPAKAITEYRFPASAGSAVSPPYLAITAAINEAAKTISFSIPTGADLRLKAEFIQTGINAKVGATVQASGVTVNDFTTPVVYTVTAADGTTAAYTVTATILP